MGPTTPSATPRAASRAPEPPEFAAAALLVQPFTIYLAVVVLALPPTADHWSHADPVLTLVPGRLAPLLVPVAGAVLGALAWRWWRPSAAVLRRAGWHALAGAVFASLAVGALRAAVGPVLPTFIPAEESAAPGVCLSMVAGYAEELVCRLIVLAAAWHALMAHRAPRVPAIAVAALASGLVFAVLHALGEREPSATYFVTRLVVPGTAFAVAALVLHPSFVVVGHCTAHVFIPLLFEAR